jgi:prepilin-type N-terminal cleavage/methylation domain-containing protein
MNRSAANSRRDRGFSLLEVMVAISVLSIVVLGISLIPALGLGRNNDARTYAVNVAREVLDSYRSLWQEQQDFRNQTGPQLPKTLRFSCKLQTPVVVSYTIDPTSLALSVTAGVAKVKKVTVVIDCPQAGQISLSTYIGDPSPAGS